MKNKILSILLPLLLLSSCGNYSPSNETKSETTNNPNKDEHGNYLIDIYGLNDFHGAIISNNNPSYYEPGFGKLATFFRNKIAENPYGTVLVASGDMWQGSADSNLTKGKMLTEMMNDVGFDAMTIGNHEFDWTTEAIYANKELANFPLLGANIIDNRTNEIADFAKPSVLIERGDVKIGLIGTIGIGLENSIQASYVENYRFESIPSIVKEQSELLKSRGADTVVLLDHASWTSIGNEQLPIVNNRYVDAVFSGHSHRYDKHTFKGVPIVQTTGNGKEIMYVQLAISPGGDVSLSNYDVLDSYTHVADLKEDASINAIYDYYSKTIIDDIKNEVVGTLSSTMYKEQLTNAAIYSMLYAAKEVDPTVAMAVHNYGGIRVGLIDEGLVTYGDLYKAIPFDNDIAIFELSGYEIQKFGGRVIAEDGLVFNPSEQYKIAVISYLYEKQNLRKEDALFYLPDYTRDYLANIFRIKLLVNPSIFASYNLNVIKD